MTFLTDFADQGVVLPLWLAVAAALAVLGWRRGAVGWLVIVAATLGAMLALKLVFFRCAQLLTPLSHVASPSGHTAAAVVVCGGMALVLLRSRRVALATAVVAWLIFGATRVLLGRHNIPEVMVGGAVGFAGLLLLSQLAGRPPARLQAGWLVAAALAVAVIFHGVHLHADTRIRQVAQLLPFCTAAQTAIDHRPDLHLYGAACGPDPAVVSAGVHGAILANGYRIDCAGIAAAQLLRNGGSAFATDGRR